MILMIDNYDSFTYNLVQELAEISGAEIEVVRNDAGTADELLARRPQAIVISPGPGTPDDAGVSMDLIRAAVGHADARDLPRPAVAGRGPRRRPSSAPRRRSTARPRRSTTTTPG